MLHCFKVCDTYLLLDTESGSLHETDGIVYKIVNGLPICKHEELQAEEVREEINQLTNEGLLNACPPDNLRMPQTSFDVKSLCLHLTHDCNLRCGYCFAEDFCSQRDYMSLQTGLSALNFLFANSGGNSNLEIDFFGGEPLMNFPLLKTLVTYGKELAQKHGKSIKFTTTTNGLLLNKDVSDYLDAEMDNIVLSLDGLRETNDKVRKTKNGSGSYDIILENFKYMAAKRASKDYYVRGTYTHLNPDFCSDVLHLADCGFRNVSVEPVVLAKGNPLALTEDDLAKACLSYEKLAREYVERRKGDKWFSFFHFAMDIDNGPCLSKRLLGCGAGTQYMAVTPDGNLYPCHQLAGNAEYHIGNVNGGGLDGAVRERMADANLLSKQECKSCWAKYYCSGGCNANAINFNNDPTKPFQAACKLMKKRIECAFYVAVMGRQMKIPVKHKKT